MNVYYMYTMLWCSKIWRLINRGNEFTNLFSEYPKRAHDAITRLLLHQNDVATSFWRCNDVIIASNVYYMYTMLWCSKIWRLINRGNEFTNLFSEYPKRAHDAITRLLLHQNDVATSFWRCNDVIIASCAHLATEYSDIRIYAMFTLCSPIQR